MAKFQVSLREVTYREIDVEAESWREAKRIVEQGPRSSSWDHRDGWPTGVTAADISAGSETVDMVQAVYETTAEVVYREGQGE